MRIVVASPDRMLRMSLMLLLESEPGMSIIGVSDRQEELSTIVEASQATVLILDDKLSKHSTTGTFIRNLHALADQPKVIVLASDTQTRERTLAAGADAVIVKNAPPDELLAVLRDIQRAEKMNMSGID